MAPPPPVRPPKKSTPPSPLFFPHENYWSTQQKSMLTQFSQENLWHFFQGPPYKGQKILRPSPHKCFAGEEPLNSNENKNMTISKWVEVDWVSFGENRLFNSPSDQWPPCHPKTIWLSFASFYHATAFLSLKFRHTIANSVNQNTHLFMFLFCFVFVFCLRFLFVCLFVCFLLFFVFVLFCFVLFCFYFYFCYVKMCVQFDPWWGTVP